MLSPDQKPSISYGESSLLPQRPELQQQGRFWKRFYLFCAEHQWARLVSVQHGALNIFSLMKTEGRRAGDTRWHFYRLLLIFALIRLHMAWDHFPQRPERCHSDSMYLWSIRWLFTSKWFQCRHCSWTEVLKQGDCASQGTPSNVWKYFWLSLCCWHLGDRAQG